MEAPPGYLLGSSSTRADVRPGLDLRGRGGYALGPGSVFGGRSSEWEIPPWEIPPQPAPPAVLKLVRDRPKFQALDTRPIPKGRRDNTLTLGILREAAGFPEPETAPA